MSATSRLTEYRLDRLLTDINARTTGENWNLALRHLSSIKDFGMGETHLCSAETALQHCAALRACFPPDTPERVFKNLDIITGEIESLKIEDVPAPPNYALPVLLIAGLGLALYWFFLR